MTRSGHSVYFSDELRERVSEWADSSSWSQADIYDMALEEFFGSHEISEDGTIVPSEDEAGYDDVDASEEVLGRLDEVLENQREMMGGGEGGPQLNQRPVPHTRSDDDSEDNPGVDELDSTRSIADRIVDLEREYNHDVAIRPEDVREAVKNGCVKREKKHLLPAFVAAVNHRLEHDELFVEPISWDDLQQMMMDVVDASTSATYNYRDEMVNRGHLYRAPGELADDVDIEDIAESVISHRRGTSVRYVDMHSDEVEATDESSEWYLSVVDNDLIQKEGYYFDVEVRNAEMWYAVMEYSRAAVHEQSWSDNRSGLHRDTLTSRERLMGALDICGELVMEMSNSGISVSSLAKLVGATKQLDSDLWNEAWIEVSDDYSRLFGDEGDEMDESEARDVIGVNDTAGDDEIREEYEEYMLSNHPDADDSSDMDRDEYQRMIEAKRALLD